MEFFLILTPVSLTNKISNVILNQPNVEDTFAAHYLFYIKLASLAYPRIPGRIEGITHFIRYRMYEGLIVFVIAINTKVSRPSVINTLA